MSDHNIKRASLAEIRAMKNAGQLRTDKHAPEAESLGADFWADAQIEGPRVSTKPVLLKLEPEVYEFFKGQGKGHVTKMQAVLKAYAKAHMPTQ